MIILFFILAILIAYPVVGWFLAKFLLGRLLDQSKFTSDGRMVIHYDSRYSNKEADELLFLFGMFCATRRMLEYWFITKEGMGTFVAFYPFILFGCHLVGFFHGIGKMQEKLFRNALEEKIQERQEKKIEYNEVKD